MMKKQAKKTVPVDKPYGMGRKRPSGLRKAAQLADWNDRRLEFRKKFAVLIYGERDRQDFRLFASEKEALLLYLQAADPCHTGTQVRDVHDEFVKILGARLYQVNCDDEELARDRIARGNALLLRDTRDPYAGRQPIVPWLFRNVH